MYHIHYIYVRKQIMHFLCIYVCICARPWIWDNMIYSKQNNTNREYIRPFVYQFSDWIYIRLLKRKYRYSDNPVVAADTKENLRREQQQHHMATDPNSRTQWCIYDQSKLIMHVRRPPLRACMTAYEKAT